MSDIDSEYMRHALRLGRRTMGATAENPAVGCLLVREEGGRRHIVGRGWTAEGGRPHAETRALEAAGPVARGATAYVTLEPCAHHGQTPPCADALVEAGVARVVIAIGDPDPRVGGRGIERLRAAGIDVAVGVCAEEARRDLAGFLSRVTQSRPHVILKLAVSADDKIAVSRDAPTTITGKRAQARSHLLRATSDAILVGVGTARADDPMLTCRLPGLEAYSPLRVVLDTGARLDPGSRLAATARDVPVLVFCGEEADASRTEALAASGVEIERVSCGPDGHVELQAVLQSLAARGAGRLLVEGGASVSTSFVAADMVDELIVFRAPRALGPQAVDALDGAGLADVLAGSRFALWCERECGEDVMQQYVRAG